MKYFLIHFFSTENLSILKTADKHIFVAQMVTVS